MIVVSCRNAGISLGFIPTILIYLPVIFVFRYTKREFGDIKFSDKNQIDDMEKSDNEFIRKLEIEVDEKYKRRIQLDSSKNINDANYGLIPTNPIYTYSIDDSEKYLKKLLTDKNQNISWKREGSICMKNIAGVENVMVDIYNIFLLVGNEKIADIYICPYGLNSEYIPKGFKKKSENNFEVISDSYFIPEEIVTNSKRVKKRKINYNKIFFVFSILIMVILILLFFKSELYRYDQLDKGDYEVLVKTNKITGQSYIFTEGGWETVESLLKNYNESQIQNYNKRILDLTNLIELAEQILDNIDQHNVSIEYYNAGQYVDANRSKVTAEDIAFLRYASEWENIADPKIFAIIGLDDVRYYMQNEFSFEEAIVDKIDIYKNEITDIKSKIIELE